MERSAIHVLHKRGLSQWQIAKELGVNRETVARVLTGPIDQPPAKRQRASLVDPYRDQIAGWVREDLSAVRMLELARADPERPYPGSQSVFRAAVRGERLKQQHGEAVARPVGRSHAARPCLAAAPPGAAAAPDRGHRRVRPDGAGLRARRPRLSSA